jgi:hypothetical protein
MQDTVETKKRHIEEHTSKPSSVLLQAIPPTDPLTPSLPPFSTNATALSHVPSIRVDSSVLSSPLFFGLANVTPLPSSLPPMSAPSETYLLLAFRPTTLPPSPANLSSTSIADHGWHEAHGDHFWFTRDYSATLTSHWPTNPWP